MPIKIGKYCKSLDQRLQFPSKQLRQSLSNTVNIQSPTSGGTGASKPRGNDAFCTRHRKCWGKQTSDWNVDFIR